MECQNKNRKRKKFFSGQSDSDTKIKLRFWINLDIKVEIYSFYLSLSLSLSLSFLFFFSVFISHLCHLCPHLLIFSHVFHHSPTSCHSSLPLLSIKARRYMLRSLSHNHHSSKPWCECLCWQKNCYVV